jgi:predicted TIM-barrel fold metal-dependent hydrolase
MGTPARKGQILDVLLRPQTGAAPGSPYAAWNLGETAFVRRLGQYGIGRAVIHPAPPLEPDFAGCVRRNRELLRLVQRFPHRFTAACAVDLRYPEESLREIEMCRKEFGMVWVSELVYPGKGPQTSVQAMRGIIEHAEKLRMIVTISADTEGAAALARDHPNAALVFSQTEFGLDPYLKRFDAIRTGGNFCVDTAPRGYERMGLIEWAVERLGPSRILFGSNFAVNSAPAVIARIENSFLHPAQKDSIFARNAERMLAEAGWKT